jgi:hypothetical protein
MRLAFLFKCDMTAAFWSPRSGGGWLSHVTCIPEGFDGLDFKARKFGNDLGSLSGNLEHFENAASFNRIRKLRPSLSFPTS